MSENNLIVKHNKLIEARYKLNLNEQKIILYAVSKLDREKKDFDVVSFDIKDFTEIIGSKGKRYDEFRETARELRKKEIIINTEDKEIITGWLSSVRFYKNTGKVTLKFDDELIPYLLHLKKHFTRYELKNIRNLKNKHSIRIYELMKQYESAGHRSFEIDKFKEILGCEDRYSEFKYFKRDVLDISIKEINKHTDLTADYEKIITGRKVVGLKFTINAKLDKQELLIKALYSNEEIENIRIKSGFDNNRFNNKQIMELYTIGVQQTDNMDIDSFEYIRLNYQSMIQKGAVRSPFAYLKKALEQDFANAKHQLKFNFNIDEDKIRKLKDEIDRTDNSFVRQILQKELAELLNK